MKRTAKKGKSSEPIGDVTLRWTSNEETLLAECFVAVSEDRNVGRSQPRDTLWFQVLNEFNRKKFQQRTKDMLSRKWSTLNHHCQKFNAIYKRCIRLKKSGENEVDLMKRARGIYQDENKNSSFNHEKAWAVLRKHAKWDAPDPAPVDLTEYEIVHDEHVPAVNTDELFDPDPRPRPPGTKMLNEGSDVLKGGIWVEVVMGQNGGGICRLVMEVCALNYSREVDGGKGGSNVPWSVMRGVWDKPWDMTCGWEVFVRWFWMGELSLEEMSMKSVRGIFFRGFWVEELALEAMEYDDQRMEGCLQVCEYEEDDYKILLYTKGHEFKI
ncbi:hypothetical protein Tco_0757374 [Tanacetum coccineum]